MLKLIAAQASNKVIGSGPDIPWQAKGEQKLFREITMNSTLIMGRKTFESIGRPLPGRETIIVTREVDYTHEGCHAAHDLDSAIDQASTLNQPIFIAGGGEIYAQAINKVNEIHLTTIEVAPEGDVFFPEFDEQDFELLDEQHFETNLKYTYRHYRRK